MAVEVNKIMNQYEQASKVRKLIEIKFYKVGDLCDLPYACPDFWTDRGTDFNDGICKPNGLDLQDQGSNVWKFLAFVP